MVTGFRLCAVTEPGLLERFTSLASFSFPDTYTASPGVACLGTFPRAGQATALTTFTHSLLTRFTQSLLWVDLDHEFESPALAAVHAAGTLLGSGGPNGETVFRVVANPARLAHLAAAALSAQNSPVDIHTYTDVLYVLALSATRYVAGYSHAANLWSKPPDRDPGLDSSCIASPADELQVANCRAQWKLRELVARGVLVIDSGWGAVVDVGAAPGSWTRYISDRTCGKVLAVDPGTLTFEFPAGNVVHIPKTCEAASADGDLEKELTASGCMVDAVFCDANIFPTNMAEVVSQTLAPIMSSGAIAVLTLKYPTKSKSSMRDGDPFSAGIVQQLVAAGFIVTAHIWLLANSRYERTLVCVKT